MSIDVAAIDVHDPRLLHEPLTAPQRELDAVLPRLDLEREPSRVVGGHPLPLVSRDVDDFDRTPLDGAGALRATHGAADRAVGRDGPRTGVDGRHASAAPDDTNDRQDTDREPGQGRPRSPGTIPHARMGNSHHHANEMCKRKAVSPRYADVSLQYE